MSGGAPGRTRIGPGKTELKAYVEQGLTQQQIAERWKEDAGLEVSRSAIAMAMRRYGLTSAHPVTRHEDTLPWRVRDQHKLHYDARMLRWLGRRQKGLPIGEKYLDMVEKWMDKLHAADAVVTYHPDTIEGFFWTPRKPEDGDGMIRRPKDEKK